MKIFYFDLETTGVKHWRNGIHQISGAVEIDGQIKEHFDFKVKPHPKAEIDPGALAVAGIDEIDLLYYEEMETVFMDLCQILNRYVDKFNKKDKFFLVGFNNAGFDNNFLRQFWLHNQDNYFGSYFWAGAIDVMVLALQRLMPERHLMKDFKQATVAAYLGIKVDESRLHDATYDTELLIQIYQIVK